MKKLRKLLTNIFTSFVQPLTTSFTPSTFIQDPQKAWDFIASLDLSEEIERALLTNNTWSRPHAEEAAHCYRHFLLMLYLYSNGENWGNILVPHTSVDEIWHAHILRTKAYQNMSASLSKGGYFHHNPGSLVKPEEDKFSQGFEQTCALIRHHFSKDTDPRKLLGRYRKELPQLVINKR